VRYLLQEGADPNLVSGGLKAPMHCAAAADSVSVLDLLLQSGADLDIRDKNCQTPLLVACSVGKKTAVEFLIMKGANFNAATARREYGIHCASRPGNVSVLQVLNRVSVSDSVVREAWKDAGSYLDAETENGWTPLQLAVVKKHLPAVEYLLRSGASVNHQSVKSKSDSGGFNALHIACFVQSSELVKLLLGYGADHTQVMNSLYPVMDPPNGSPNPS
jgi:ankyrin repeat protein